MTLQSYQYGFLERLWLKLEARSADKNTENIITILPVVLFMQKEQLDTLLEKLPTILTHYLKPHLIQRVFSHIVIKLKSYAKNEQLFMQERGDALELIATNIQLYALVLDLFEDKEDHELAIIEQIVRKKFDKDYQLNKENLRLLTYQEKYCVDKTLNKTRAKPNSTKL
ncbi:hypothetical protein [Helicobacter japonicus]|uniref:Uncharacterized protein n=2 Tax=Helicobacter japonicus TaxID=425400 RepID=A0A4U8TKS0_9HELI|nr:hypothetical protein [Helicobacter japonicus]TLE01031.1 hypothetical protein LS65_006895 [Helicobacter japonicus]